MTRETEAISIKVSETNWETKYNIPNDHEWKIKFNRDVMKETVNSNNIKVYEKYTGNPFPTTYDIEKNIIKVIPLSKYKEGHSYILEISNNVKSVEGTPLNKSIKMEFVIKIVENKLVEFFDINLDIKVRQEIGKLVGNLTVKDLENLKVLNVQNSGIKDIRGLEKAVNLEKVDLRGNNLDESALSIIEMLIANGV